MAENNTGAAGWLNIENHRSGLPVVPIFPFQVSKKHDPVGSNFEMAHEYQHVKS